MFKHNLLNMFLVVVLLALGSGCPPEPDPDLQMTDLGEAFTLEFEETEEIPSEGLSLKFTKVVLDSRCPTDVTCVTAGFVKVEVLVNQNGQSLGIHALAIGEGVDQSTADVGDYRIELLAVDPYPDDPDRPIPQSDYEIKLVVERR